MKRSKLASQRVIPNLPKWSEAYRNPQSAARVISNSMYREIDYLNETYPDSIRHFYLRQLNPLEEPYRNWISIEEDVTPSGEITQSEVFSDLDTKNIQAYISGQSIGIEYVGSPRAYLYPEPQSYKVDYRIPVSGTNHNVSGVYDVSGDALSYSGISDVASIIDNKAYIVMDSITSGSPNLLSINLSREFEHGELDEPYITSGDIEIDVSGELINTYIDSSDLDIVSGDYLTFTQEDDPLIRETTIQITLKETNSSYLLPHYAIGAVEVTNAYNDDSDVTFAVTETMGTYTTDKYKPEYDFNNDGLINSKEYTEIRKNTGKSSLQYTPKTWDEKYAKYDINNDGTITTKDLELFKSYMYSSLNHGTIITVEENGIFNVTYSYTESGGNSYVYNENGTRYLDTKKYNNVEPNLPESWVAVAYSDLLGARAYLDKDQNRITFVKYASDVKTLVEDRFDVVLPILNNYERPVALDIYQKYMYVLIKGGTFPYFLRYDLTGNMHDNYDIVAVHKRAKDDDVVIRNSTGLSDPIGFGIISKNILIVIDKTGNGFLNAVILKGVFDYATEDEIGRTGVNSLFTREKYDQVYIDSNLITQYYFHLWSKFDDFAFENGIDRIPGEGNAKLRERLLDYLNNYPDPSKDMIEKELKREFDIWS